MEAGSRITLELQIDAEEIGPVSGLVILASNDDDEASFRFAVSGKVVAPEISVHDGGVPDAPELISGQSGAVDFGRRIQGSPGTRQFTVTNTGNAPLLLRGLTLPDGYIPDPSVPVPLTVPPGGNAVITVSLISTDVGPHAGMIVLENDDPDEAEFTFPVTGEVYPDFPGQAAGMPVKPRISENRVATRRGWRRVLSRRAGP